MTHSDSLCGFCYREQPLVVRKLVPKIEVCHEGSDRTRLRYMRDDLLEQLDFENLLRSLLDGWFVFEQPLCRQVLCAILQAAKCEKGRSGILVQDVSLRRFNIGEKVLIFCVRSWQRKQLINVEHKHPCYR